MGTMWPRSGSLEFDSSGTAADGALAYFYSAGTTTPLTVYQDGAESTPHEDPVEADGNGRWPLVFIPFGTYKFVLKTSGGTTLFTADEVPNAAPTSPGTSVDANAILNTGDIFHSLKNGTRAGAVRLNGRTIGDASSVATERANADTADLFAFLWNNLANGQAAVSTGRGATAVADYAAHKTIALPDFRACSLVGFDDMGNSAASLLGSAPVVSGSGILAGSILGANTHTLLTAHLPITTPAGTVAAPTFTGNAFTPVFTGTGATITATGTIAVTDGRTWATSGSSIYVLNGVGPGGVGGGANATTSSAVTVSATGSITAAFTGTGVSYTPAGTIAQITPTGSNSAPAFTGTPFGSGTAHNILSRAGVVTYYIKL